MGQGLYAYYCASAHVSVSDFPKYVTFMKLLFILVIFTVGDASYMGVSRSIH